MTYLLDSNTVSELYDPEATHNDRISAHVSALGEGDGLYISILSVYELEYGWANAPAEKQADIRQVITDIQADFTVLGLSAQGAMVFGNLKKHIKETRSPSKENMKKFNIDVMMASTAITHQIILVSADTVYADLQRHDSSLQVENWMV
jgi:predicted nucleic acid-binding protein